MENELLNGSTAHSFNDADDFELLPAGDYEVILESAAVKEFKTGTRGLNCKYRIRSDVDQPGKNRVIFETLFLDRNDPNWYDLRKMGKIIATTPTVADGGQRDFKNCDEAILYINGVSLRLTVDRHFDENLQKEVNGIVYLSYKAPTAPRLGNPGIGGVTSSLTTSAPADLAYPSSAEDDDGKMPWDD